MITYVVTVIINLIIFTYVFFYIRIEKWKMQKKELEIRINHAQDLLWFQTRLREALRTRVPKTKKFKFGK